MAKYTCSSRCDLLHPFNRGKRGKCERVRKCACRGEKLAAMNPNLSKAFVSACQSQPSKDPDEFLCKEIGGATLFNQYGIEACGFNPMGSFQGQQYLLSLKQGEQEEEAQAKLINYAMIVAVVILIVFGMILIKKRVQ